MHNETLSIDTIYDPMFIKTLCQSWTQLSELSNRLELQPNERTIGLLARLTTPIYIVICAYTQNFVSRFV
jgi:hypothetical protein